MAGTQTTVEFLAPIKRAYEVISDFKAYPEFLPETKKVVIEQQTKNSAIVTFTVTVIKKITYTLDISLDPPQGISWTMVKGQVIKSNVGGWQLTEKKKGLTLAEYNIDIGLGILVPKSIAKTLIGSSLPTMMEAFKKRIEES